MASHTKSELREAGRVLAAAIPSPAVAPLQQPAVFDGLADAA
jgi:hypothetical protein